MMMYEEVVKDFAKRTLLNLAEIEKLQSNGVKVFEVTQLINSCVGLLIFPQQDYINRIEKIPIEQLKQDGWSIPKLIKGKQVKDLNELARYLRNAIAHYNIEFIGDGAKEIKVLRVWNMNRGKNTCEAEFSIDDLREFVKMFSNMLIEY